MVKTKEFKLFDAILAAVCIVLVVEAAAPAAAIGNSQFFWWIFLLITFFLPYGLISAELGTTYEDEGGIYDWVKRAYGHKWGSRVAWYYWINFPLWMASLAVLFTDIMLQIFNLQLSTWALIAIQLAFIWIVVIISFYRVSDSKWILNIAAFFKAFIMLALGVLGVYVALTRGVANEFTFTSFLPSFNLVSLSFISVILFNFMGFEVVTTFASDMKNPKKQIPQAIILGGILIAVFYLLAAFGISVAIPVEDLSTSSGLIESFQLLLNRPSGILIIAVGIMFMYTLFANLISWSLGVNYVAQYAALNHSLPKIYAKGNPKTDMPVGANIMNGLVATVLILIAPLIPTQDLFWSFFALNMITLLLSYIFIFPSFIKLRKIDPDKERIFKVSGSMGFLKVLAIVPMILLIIAIGFSIIPFNLSAEELAAKLPVLLGTAIAILIGEVIVATSARQIKKDSKN